MQGIPKELQKKLEEERAQGKKPLPDLNLGNENAGEGGAARTEEASSPAVPVGAELESLVEANESNLAPVIGTPQAPPTPEDLAAKVAKYKAIIDSQNGQIKDLKAKVAQASTRATSDDSRRFRIFLSLIEGFSAKGAFSEETLVSHPTQPQTKLTAPQIQARLTKTAQHVANLVEHLYLAIDRLPENMRF